MKHLKNVKERRGVQDSEFDLRGLGETSAIQAEYPMTHLSVQTENAQVVKKAAEVFSLDIKESKVHKNVFHLFSPRHDLSHKEKSIILFGASMYLSQCEPSVSMLMNEISRLAKLFKDENPNDAEDCDGNVIDWLKTRDHLSVHPGMQLYLHQSGFDIQPEAGFQTFRGQSLKNLRKHSSKNVSRKKVVGE